MYIVGAPHPNKAGAQHLLEQAVLSGQRLVTDAEVIQEVLHRYVAINRRDAISPALDVLLEVVDEVFPIERQDALAARDVVLGATQLSARDAIHVAVMRRRGVRRIITFARGFDGVPGLTRVV